MGFSYWAMEATLRDNGDNPELIWDTWNINPYRSAKASLTAKKFHIVGRVNTFFDTLPDFDGKIRLRFGFFENLDLAFQLALSRWDEDFERFRDRERQTSVLFTWQEFPEDFQQVVKDSLQVDYAVMNASEIKYWTMGACDGQVWHPTATKARRIFEDFMSDRADKPSLLNILTRMTGLEPPEGAVEWNGDIGRVRGSTSYCCSPARCRTRS